MKQAKEAVRVLTFVVQHPMNRNTPVRAIARALWWQVRKRLFSNPKIVRLSRAAQFNCYPHSSISSLVVYCNGRPDYVELAFLERMLRPGDNCLDVGANIGLYSVFCGSLVAPHGKLTCIEASADTARRLQENLELNNLRAEVIVSAATNEEGTVSFVSNEDATNHIAYHEGEDASSVPAIRLDSLDLPDLMFAKLDIEGAEPLALEGASGLLSRGTPRVIQLELNGRLNHFGWTEEELAQWLQKRGYRPALFSVAEQCLVFEPTPWKHTANVLFIHDDSLDLVDQRLGRPSRRAEPRV